MRVQPDRTEAILLVNVAMFLVAHFVLTAGTWFASNSFYAALVGVSTGVAGYATWRHWPQVWRRRSVGFGLAALTVGLYSTFSITLKPPPPPEPFAIIRQPDGSYRFNRGGGQLVGRVYLVRSDDALDGPSAPRDIGAVKVIDSLSYEETLVDWLGVRLSYRDRERYSIVPLPTRSSVPSQRDFATWVSTHEDGRAVLDVGRIHQVKPDDVYAVHAAAGPGRAGYLVVEAVESDEARAFLVDVTKPAPQELMRLGTVNRIVTEALARAELQWRRGETGREGARKSYALIDALTRGTNTLARERLAQLSEPPQATP